MWLDLVGVEHGGGFPRTVSTSPGGCTARARPGRHPSRWPRTGRAGSPPCAPFCTGSPGRGGRRGTGRAGHRRAERLRPPRAPRPRGRPRGRRPAPGPGHAPDLRGTARGRRPGRGGPAHRPRRQGRGCAAARATTATADLPRHLARPAPPLVQQRGVRQPRAGGPAPAPYDGRRRRGADPSRDTAGRRTGGPGGQKPAGRVRLQAVPRTGRAGRRTAEGGPAWPRRPQHPGYGTRRSPRSRRTWTGCTAALRRRSTRRNS